MDGAAHTNKRIFLLFAAPVVLGGFLGIAHIVFAANSATVNATIQIVVCGNGIQESGEQCDGSDLNGASCTSLGYGGGTLSCTVACDFDTSACTAPVSGGGGGGGGGGGLVVQDTKVEFSGRAYPLSKVTVLKDGQEAATTVAGPDAKFDVSLSGLATGSYNFALYGTDSKGVRSSLFTFPISVTSGTTAKVSGIFIAPTIAVDKSEVRQGDTLEVFGQSTPNSTVTVGVHSSTVLFATTTTDSNGIYLYDLDTTPLALDTHTAQSKTTEDNTISPYSATVSFLVGTQNITSTSGSCPGLIGDFNGDCRVNLVDFSIEAYWYKRTTPPAANDLNSDGKVDITDFSIMAYYWTG